MHPSYSAHDRKYRQFREQGQAGWSTAEEYEKFVVEFEPVLHRPYVPKAGKLLELGCGAGNRGLWLAEKGYEVYGVDIAPTAIEWAKELAATRGLKADFRVGDVRDLRDFADDTFDLILDSYCLHCIIGEADRSAFLRSAFRVLKLGGFLHVRTMAGEYDEVDARFLAAGNQRFDPKTRCIFVGDLAIRYKGLATDILAEVRVAGFTVLRRDDIWSSVTGGELLIDCTRQA